ncbi:hypothetical protein BABINDRAFT_163265 [Babjeviella inositovora NRRL Y-12698]|uniref:Mediator of RNA polymerase II transcription subunit 12 n=1 Tax=Babjeviella inositovora NRRL Y-12698 TaxID=984486 RepID=A0A1E3QJM4_9ASCO|nr:uncharacterized protein BABINDRAFT_163265 [Babjeviella inositovora NRRL Y-12698]ODQ77893.1 hypothetical protein BABINDRAFT_163265 [Babjeviella inositovora NRRL Y-12698]
MYYGKTATVFSTPKDELTAKKYLLTRPADVVYPLDHEAGYPPRETPGKTHTYPDFAPWHHSSHEDELAVTNLHKGYSEPAATQNEFLLARGAMSTVLCGAADAAVARLSAAMLQTIQHHEAFNKIPAASHSFKLPPRVTLTDQKREAWLANLANAAYPLRQLSRTIPHGLKKNKMLQQCVEKRIPCCRAVWFVKCISGNEIRLLARKATRADAWWALETEWVREWTHNILDHVHKLAHDLREPDHKPDRVKGELAYVMRLVGTLFMERMLDRAEFLSGILELMAAPGLAPDEPRLECVLVGLQFVSFLWKEYLAWADTAPASATSLTVSLVRVYVRVQQYHNTLRFRPGPAAKQLARAPLLANLIHALQQKLCLLFRSRSGDNFIFPDEWPSFQWLVAKDNWLVGNADDARHWDVISYRNECLCGNIMSGEARAADTCETATAVLVARLDRLLAGDLPLNAVDELHELVMDSADWAHNIQTVVHWSCSGFRHHPLTPLVGSRILASFHSHEPDYGLRLEIERAVLDAVYSIPDHLPESAVQSCSLHRLVKELFQCRLFNIGSYVRKLISSGLLYDPAEGPLLFHVSVFINLPITHHPASLNQVNMILRKLGHAPMDDARQLLELNLLAQQIATSVIEPGAGAERWECHVPTLAMQNHLCQCVLSELRVRIAQSERLIHVTPAKVTMLYRFFTANGCLEAFFDDFVVKVLLKNEDKVLIYYLDSLYLIAELVQHHQLFLMWSSLCNPANDPAGNRRYSKLRRAREIGTGLPTAAAELPERAKYYCLFALTDLLMDSFLDLKDDGFFLRFSRFWQASLRMLNTCAPLWNLDEVARAAFCTKLEKVMVEENNSELNLHGLLVIARELLAPHDDFFTQTPLTPSESNVLLVTQANFNALMNGFISEPDEANFLRLFHHYCTNFPAEFAACMKTYLSVNYAKLLGDTGLVYRVFVKFLTHQVVELVDLVLMVHEVDPAVKKSMMVTETFNGIDSTHFYPVLYEILFTDSQTLDNSPVFQTILSKDQQLRLEILVGAYRTEHPQEFVSLLAHGLLDENTDGLQRTASHSTLTDLDAGLFDAPRSPIAPPSFGIAQTMFYSEPFANSYRVCLLATVAELAITDIGLLIDKLFTQPLIFAHYTLFVDVLNALTMPRGDANYEGLVNSTGTLAKIPLFINEFNLPFYQLLIRLILDVEASSDPSVGVRTVIQNILEVTYTRSTVVLGESIRYLSEPFQSSLLQECEAMLLKSQALILQMLEPVGGEEHASATRVTHVLAGIISKSSQLVKSEVLFSGELLKDLHRLLEMLIEASEAREANSENTAREAISDNIMNGEIANEGIAKEVTSESIVNEKIINKTTVNEAIEDEVPAVFSEAGRRLVPNESAKPASETQYVLSFFCKILLINYQQIVHLLMEDPGTLFFDDLIRLLQLKVLEEDTKIKILLYDILLLMRSSVKMLIKPDTDGGFVQKLFDLPKLSAYNPLRSGLEAVRDNLKTGNDVRDRQLCVLESKTGKYHPFYFKNSELLEDSNPVSLMNDTTINMAMFDTAIERRNPT